MKKLSRPWSRTSASCLVLRALVCLFLLLTLGRADAGIEVGAAKRIITPDPLLPVSGGMGPTEPATKKMGELAVRAVVVVDGPTRLAMVSVDALGFPSVLVRRIAERVPAIPLDHILVGATHTHSAPDFYAFPDAQGGHTGDLKYIQRVCELAAEAINEAYEARQPAQLQAATGEVQGQVAYNYYAPDLYDRRASVLRFLSKDGTTIACLVNYAVHPEVLGASQGIVSPDLIGPLCDTLEKELGGMALFFNGAQGGMVTADNRDLNKPRDPLRGYWHDVQTWQECERIGNQLARESIRMIRDASAQQDITLKCLTRQVRFPVESADMWAVVKYSPLQYPHNDDQSITARLNLVTLGNVQIATIPGEALPNIGFYLKRKMTGEHNLLFGLTNDAFGYILTKVDYQSFPRYDYISAVSLGEMTGEILIENVEQMVAESKSSAGR